MLAKIRVLNRVLCVGETLHHTLNCLAIAALDWLQAYSYPEWVDHYDAHMESVRTPPGKETRCTFVEVIKDNDASVLSAIYEASPDFLCEIPAVETLW